MFKILFTSFKKNIFLYLIIFLSIFLRTYKYPDRWALAQDQAWFVIISKYAIDTLQIPLLGPFASGGPYQTGGEWFWIIMFGIFLNQNYYLSPWILMTVISVVFVYLMFHIGKKILGYRFGLLSSLLTAVSTTQTLQATNLTNQTPIVLISGLFLLFCYLCLDSKKKLHFYLLGFFGGLASAVHLQGILLIPILFIYLLINKFFSPKKILLIFIGIFSPWIPVLIADMQNGFYNTINILSYFNNSQSQTPYEVLGRRWLTFITVYMPESWARIVGGETLIGYMFIISSGIIFLYLLYKRRLSKLWLFIYLSTFLTFVILRYIRSPLYETYLVFLHPFILLVSSFVLFLIIKKYRRIGLGILFLIIFFSIKETFSDVGKSTNYAYPETERISNILIEKYPDKKFTIYDFQNERANITFPLVMNLYYKGKIDLNGEGIKIGYAIKHTSHKIDLGIYDKFWGNDYAPQMFDLGSSSSADLIDAGWKIRSPKYIYNNVQYWYKEKS